MLLFYFLLNSCRAASSTLDSTSEQIIASSTNCVWIIIVMFSLINFYFKKFSLSLTINAILTTFSSFVFRYLLFSVAFKEGQNAITFADATLCALSCIISLGCFNGVVKLFHYILYGILFAATYTLVHWLVIEGDVIKNVIDTGHAIEVHLFAASFGLGTAIVVREKRIVGTTFENAVDSHHWVLFATLIIAFLWPKYTTIYLTITGVASSKASTAVVIAVCGSSIVSLVFEHFVQKKIDIYRFANSIFVGCIGIGCSVLIVGPWGALLVGAICGLANTFLMTPFSKFIEYKIGAADLLSVSGVNGISAWIAIFVGLISAYIKKQKGVQILVGGLITLGVGLVCGAVTGAIILITKCGEIPNAEFMNDAAFFDIKDPENDDKSKAMDEL